MEVELRLISRQHQIPNGTNIDLYAKQHQWKIQVWNDLIETDDAFKLELSAGEEISTATFTHCTLFRTEE